MHVATMTTENFSFVALDHTADLAVAAMAAGFDRHLETHGDDDRTRFLYSIGAVDSDSLDVEVASEFGTDLRGFAVALHDWYGIAVFSLNPGEAKEYGDSDGWRWKEVPLTA